MLKALMTENKTLQYQFEVLKAKFTTLSNNAGVVERENQFLKHLETDNNNLRNKVKMLAK